MVYEKGNFCTVFAMSQSLNYFFHNYYTSNWLQYKNIWPWSWGPLFKKK